MSKPNEPSASPSSPQFESTCWSMVLQAGRGSSPDARAALDALCRIYWFPLYAYVRRRGYQVHEAQDLTQEFFACLLENDVVEAADPSRGRFRSFLLASLQNFLANQWDFRNARKRGGGRRTIPLDFADGDVRYANDATHQLTPERLYERQWAIALLDQVMAQLRDEYINAGKRMQFEQLSPMLAGRGTATSYDDVGHALGISAGAAMAATARLRKRYQTLLRIGISHTLADPRDVGDEIRRLFEILGS